MEDLLPLNFWSVSCMRVKYRLGLRKTGSGICEDLKFSSSQIEVCCVAFVEGVSPVSTLCVFVVSACSPHVPHGSLTWTSNPNPNIFCP